MIKPGFGRPSRKKIIAGSLLAMVPSLSDNLNAQIVPQIEKSTVTGQATLESFGTRLEKILEIKRNYLAPNTRASIGDLSVNAGIHNEPFKTYFLTIDNLLSNTEKNNPDRDKLILSFKLIEEYSGDLDDFIGFIDPEILKDPKSVKKSLDLIPQQFIHKFHLTVNFLENEKVSEVFNNPNIAKILDFMSQNSIYLKSSDILILLELQSKKEDARLLKVLAELTNKVSESAPVTTADKKYNEILKHDYLSNILKGLQKYADSEGSRNFNLYDIIKFLENLNQISKTFPNDVSGFLFNERFSVQKNNEFIYRIGSSHFVDFFLETNKGFSSSSFYQISSFEYAAKIPESYYSDKDYKANFLRMQKTTQVLTWEKMFEYRELIRIQDFVKALEKVPFGKKMDFIMRMNEVWNNLSGDKKTDFFDLAILYDKFLDTWGNTEFTYELVFKFLDLHKLSSLDYMKIVLDNPLSQSVTIELQLTDGNKKITEYDSLYLKSKTGYTTKEVLSDLNLFLELKEKNKEDLICLSIFQTLEGQAFVEPILKVNELHNEDTSKRLEVIKNYNAKTLFKIMLKGGPDSYLSTFRITYNGNGYSGRESEYAFLQKTKIIGMSNFFMDKDVEGVDIISFIKLLSRFNILEEFIKDLGGKEEIKKILNEKVFKELNIIETSSLGTFTDLLNSANLDVKSATAEFIRSKIDSIDLGPEERANTIALIVNHYIKTENGKPPKELENIFEKYKGLFKLTPKLGGERLFRKIEGMDTNIQLNTFFDDRKDSNGNEVPEKNWDGHNSFRNFFNVLGGRTEREVHYVGWDKTPGRLGIINNIKLGDGWQFVDDHQAGEFKGDLFGNKKGYVVISKTIEDGNKIKRRIINYVIRPDLRHSNAVELGKKLMDLNPQIAAHGGHSYHLEKTMDMVRYHYAGMKYDLKQNPNDKTLLPLSFFNARSCGGESVFTPLYELDSSIQPLGTRGIGTMLVNDVTIRRMNMGMFAQGFLDWKPIYDDLKSDLANEPRFAGYVFPHMNELRMIQIAKDEILKDLRKEK